MTNILKGCLPLLLLFLMDMAAAQGPPITSDKPIMLGAKRKVIKTLVEIRSNENDALAYMPLMFHYLPSSNTLLGVHLPAISHSDNGWALGDIGLLFKYQFLRKDKMGQTFRLVAKTIQTLPSGPRMEMGLQYMGLYRSYWGLVAGFESLHYGISSELGYQFVPGRQRDEFQYKLGFGLPLLPSTYPVKQVNLYFESAQSWAVDAKEWELLYAQGIQYALGQFIYEASFQFPLVQTLEDNRRFSIFLGTRYVF